MPLRSTFRAVANSVLPSFVTAYSASILSVLPAAFFTNTVSPSALIVNVIVWLLASRTQVPIGLLGAFLSSAFLSAGAAAASARETSRAVQTRRDMGRL